MISDDAPILHALHGFGKGRKPSIRLPLRCVVTPDGRSAVAAMDAYNNGLALLQSNTVNRLALGITDGM